MQSPIIILLASIIPGLGLWLIGKRDHAMSVALIVVGFILVSLVSPWRILTSLTFYIAFFLWVIQGIYTGYEARLAEEIESGDLEEATDITPIALPPSNLSHIEKQAFRAKEIVRQQLEDGEIILDAIPATQMSALKGAGSYRLYYVGLLQNKLAIVNTDFMGNPAAIEHLNFSSIHNLSVKHGLIQDNLIIFVKPDKPVKLLVTRWLRAHTDNFVSVFSKQKIRQA